MVFFQCLLSINKERYVLVSNSMYNLHTFYLENIYLIFKRQKLYRILIYINPKYRTLCEVISHV